MRRTTGAVALAAVVLLAAGCGGGAKTPAVARLGTTTTTGPTPASYLRARIRWAECIRSHGVPNFPDPNADGSVNLTGIDIALPQFLAAHRDCASLEVALPPAQLAQEIRGELAVARCMRRHGVPSFPDPPADGKTAADWQSVTSTPVGARAAKICNPGSG